MSRSVLQNWIMSLPQSQQLQIILTLRSCDSISKDDPSRLIIKEFRKATLQISLPSDQCLSDLDKDNEERDFRKLTTKMCSDSNKYPVNFYRKLMHGAMIVGYKHPDIKNRKRWLDVYTKMVESMSLIIETEQDVDNRLSD